MDIERDPRVILFGDITGIPADTISQFLKTAGHPPFGGSFPDCRNRQEAAVAEEERVRQILQNNAGRPIIIIDKDPKSLVQTVARIQEGPQADLLSHTTVINLGPGEPFDYVDPNTGVRIVTLPPYCYPTHPTPAS